MGPNGGSVAVNSYAGLSKLDFAERDNCKPVLLRLSLAGNLENHFCPSMGPNGGGVWLWTQGNNQEIVFALSLN
jgi:hypothetical protein